MCVGRSEDRQALQMTQGPLIERFGLGMTFPKDTAGRSAQSGKC